MEENPLSVLRKLLNGSFGRVASFLALFFCAGYVYARWELRTAEVLRSINNLSHRIDRVDSTLAVMDQKYVNQKSHDEYAKRILDESNDENRRLWKAIGVEDNWRPIK